MMQKGRKIGVNEPCPCGSGRKYKKCCKDKGIDFPPAPVPLKHPILSKYNTADLLKKLAGLSIMPENFGKFYRLENATMAVLENANNSKELIPQSVLKRWIETEYSPTGLEDPVVNFVTDLVTFRGQDFLVFPGMTPNGASTLRDLLMALFQNKRFDFPDEFLFNCDEAISLLLNISNLIASRNGLQRYQLPPETDGDIDVPDRTLLLNLAGAVALSEQEMDDLLNANRIEPSSKYPFILLRQHVADHSNDDVEIPFAVRPFVVIDKELIVVAPTNICNALEKYIWSEANRFGITNALSNSLAYVLGHNSISYLIELGFAPLANMPPNEESILQYLKGIIFRFDENKVAYLNAIGLPEGQSNISANHDESEILSLIYGLVQVEPQNVLIIDLMFTNGMGPFFLFDKPEIANRIILTTYEVEILSKSGKTDAIGLWQFAEASRMQLGKVASLSYSFLNQFALYKDQDDSFYLGDHARPDLMTVDLDYGTRYMQDALLKEDSHSVSVRQEGKIFPSFVRRNGPFVPLYFSYLDAENRNPRNCLDLYAQPIWIQPRFESMESLENISNVHFEMIDAIGFWLWKLAPRLRPHLDEMPSMPIDLWFILEPIEEFVNPSVDSPFDQHLAEKFEVRVNDWNIYIRIPSAILPYMLGQDNAGERVLVVKLLEGFSQLLVQQGLSAIGREEIAAITDQCAPLGPMKKLLLLDTAEVPILVEGNMLPVRYVQSHNVNHVLDSIVPTLGNFCPPEGLIGSKSEKKKLCRNIVMKVLLPQLKSLLPKFNSTDLIMRLIGVNEGLIHERERLKLLTPSRIACFVSVEEQTEELNQTLRKLDTTSVAVRCLLEHLAAEPGLGTEQISVTATDQVIAIMEQVVQWGMLGDIIEYDLFDVEMSILPSGRVGQKLATQRAVFDSFRLAKTSEMVVDARDAYDQTFPAQFETKLLEKDVHALNQGFIEEFGISFSRLREFMHCLVAIGFLQDKHFAILPKSELISAVNELIPTKFEADEAEAVLAYLSLENRGAVEKVIAPYEHFDISPWRYNRRLSMLRKPLIRVDNPENEHEPQFIWGARLSWVNISYLLELCLNCRLRVNEGGKLQEVLVKISQRLARDFVVSIGDRIQSEVSKFDMEVEIGPNCKLHNSQLIGDIDVFVICHERQAIYSIECKCIAPTRTVKEMVEEIDKLVGGGSNKGWIDKHVRRHEWLEAHLEVVGAAYGCELSNYTVKSFIATKEDMLTPYLKKNTLKMPFVTKYAIQEKGIAAFEEAYSEWERNRQI